MCNGSSCTNVFPVLVNFVVVMKKNIIIYKYIPVLTIFVLGLVSIFWPRGNNIVAIGDYLFPHEQVREARRFFFSWDWSSLGKTSYRNHSLIVPYGFYLIVMDLFNISPVLSQILWNYFLFVSMGLSMYFLVLTLIGDRKEKGFIALISATFFMFNPWTAINYAMFIPYVVFTPLILALYIKLLNSRKNSTGYFFLLPLIWWFTSSYAYVNIRGVILQWIFILLYLFYFIIINPEKMFESIKRTLLLLLSFLLVTMYCFLPLIVNLKEVIYQTADSYNNIRFVWSDTFNLNSASVTGIFRALGLQLLEETYRGDSYFPWFDNYQTVFFIILGFGIFIFALFPVFNNKSYKSYRNKDMVFFLFSLLFGFTIMMGNGNILTRLLARRIPFFVTVFSLAYFYGGIFFILSLAVLLGYSCIYFLDNCKIKIKKIALYAVVFLMILIYGFPVWSGDFIYEGGRVLGSGRMNIPLYVYDLKDKVEKQKLNFRIFPVSYSMLGYYPYTWGSRGFNGVDPIENILGKSVISGSGQGLQVAKLLEDDTDVEEFLKMCSFLNVKYILYKNDTNTLFIKDHSWYVNPNEKFIKSLYNSGLNIYSYGKMDLIEVGNDYFFPRFYIPRYTLKSAKKTLSMSDFPSLKTYDNSYAVYSDQSTKSINKITDNPVVEYKLINPIKYRLVLHNVSGKVPLVFNENFHKGWKIYLDKYEKDKIVFDESDYKIFDGNKYDQADANEIKDFVNRGYISTLGDLRERKIKHTKWSDNKKYFDYEEIYKIDFISKNLKGTVQNDNLKDGKFYETWFRDSIDDSNHYVVNNYANSWILDSDKICSNDLKCVKNSDGTYDFEVILEFKPQRIYYFGLFISSVSIVTFLFIIIRRKFVEESF